MPITCTSAANTFYPAINRITGKTDSVTPIPDQPHCKPSEVRVSRISRVRVRIRVSVRIRVRFSFTGVFRRPVVVCLIRDGEAGGKMRICGF